MQTLPQPSPIGVCVNTGLMKTKGSFSYMSSPCFRRKPDACGANKPRSESERTEGDLRFSGRAHELQLLLHVGASQVASIRILRQTLINHVK